MSKPFVDRNPFAKVLIGLAILFALSLGLWGLGFALIWNGRSVPQGMDRLMNEAAGYDVLVMVYSAAGLLVTAIIWVVLTVASSFGRQGRLPAVRGTQKSRQVCRPFQFECKCAYAATLVPRSVSRRGAPGRAFSSGNATANTSSIRLA